MTQRPSLLTRVRGFVTHDGPPEWHEWRAAECARKADELEEEVKLEMRALLELPAERIVILRHLAKLHQLVAEQRRKQEPR